MKLNYKQLGQFIRQVDVRNAAGKEENLLGVSVQKTFIPSIANTVGTDFTKYKVVRRGQFTYIPDTSRRGDKIGIALLSDYDEGLVSNVYTTFEVIDKNELLPEYLMLWFSRPEFDRYARFKSHGSVREVMDWDEMCKVQLPVPPISVQRDIVKAYQTITNRIALKRQVNDNLEAVLAASHSKMFFSKDTSEHSKLGELMTFGNGKSRPKTDGPIPVYGGNGVLSYTDHHNIENAVLIGRVGAYCGSVYLEQGICWVSDNAIFAKSKITKDEFFDYFLLKRLNLFNHHVGTGQQLLTQEILNNIEVPKPVTEQIELFNRKAASVFETIFTNSREIIRLQELSDLLLSRLAG